MVIIFRFIDCEERSAGGSVPVSPTVSNKRPRRPLHDAEITAAFNFGEYLPDLSNYRASKSRINLQSTFFL